METLLVMGDGHPGSVVGLTPPGWWQSKNFKFHDTQVKLWKEFDDILNQIHRDWPSPTTLICVGDMVHGKEHKQGGVETITGDVEEQAEIGIAIFEHIGIKNIYMVYGTPYHTDVQGQKMEKSIATHFDAVAGNRIFPVINGIRFDIRHHVPTSTLPESRPRIIATQWSRARDWFMEGVQPLPDILIRGHAHYYSEARGTSGNGEWFAFTCPGLQGLGSSFGERRCDGVIHFGMVVLAFNGDTPICKPYIRRPQIIE